MVISALGSNFKPSETTLELAELILAGYKLTAADVVERGLAVDRIDASGKLRNTIQYLRKHHADRAVGYVPPQNGDRLGTYQILKSMEDRVGCTRFSMVKARGYIGGSANVVRSAPRGLRSKDKVIWIESLRPDVTQVLASFSEITFQLIGSADPAAQQKLLNGLNSSLEEA